MSVPHLLLVDDSDAILTYEAAALSSHYTVSTATNGREALEKLQEIRPAAVLLDLSMPEMTGDDLLERMQADATLRRIPVIIVSSERGRGEAATKRGARAFLPKPIRAPELQALVARVLEEERQRARGDELAVLVLGVGALEVGIPLDTVREILAQPMTTPLPVGPEYLRELIDYRGTPVLVLDLATRLRAEHSEAIQERKLVVIELAGHLLALSMDRVREPELFASTDLLSRTELGGGDNVPLLAVLKTPRGPVPVIAPETLVSTDDLDRLLGILRGEPLPEPA